MLKTAVAEANAIKLIDDASLHSHSIVGSHVSYSSKAILEM